MKNHDYIVIGAGSAGCVVATRLIEETDATVLLLEAGPEDNTINARMPAGMPHMMANYVWPYETEAEHFAHHRRLDVPQGKVLGGGSSVNGMAYVRGIPEDYDDWETRYGCTGWSYQDVLPFFIACEKNEVLSGRFHGTQGDLHVSENRYRHVLTRHFIQAGQELGFEYNNDFNGDVPNGVGFFQTTTYQGRRASTAYCFLERVKRHPRLTLVTCADAESIHFEGLKATAVSYRHKNQTIYAKANKEIIVCAGAIATPKLLMLSGIGPQEHLEEMGINTIMNAPLVGKNYQDHLHVNISASLKEPISMLKQSKGIRKFWAGLEWLLFKQGIVTSTILEGCGFFDLDGDGRRETQIHSFPLIENFGNKDEVAQEVIEGFTLKLGHVYPQSRGYIELRSNRAQDLPKIFGNYLSEPEDIVAKVRAVKFGLSFFEAPALKKIIKAVIFPDPVMREDDASIEAFVREYAKTVFHPVGTCAMGADANTSVLDTRLRVRGIEGLRVMDASAFPHIPSGNTNAPVIMLAYKGVDHLIKNSLN